ncbi:MAG: hypothetical protein WDZ59_05655 [Pirellulales bacterium]
MSITGEDILKVTQSVTKKWTKQRKAEERGSRTPRMYAYSDRVNFSDVAAHILPKAYEKASGGGKYSVSKRQLYYASREAFKEATGRPIEYPYFAQTLLVQYLNRTPVTGAWKVTADPRGNLTIPNSHSEIRVPCGTLAIERHLREAAGEIAFDDDIGDSLPIEWPSKAEGQRYQAVLYIEKEGFEPLLKEARIAEQFDLAIMSCKGQSVVAARQFVDHACRVDGGVPLLVVHDFDKHGFEISQRLTSISDWADDNDRVAYYFENEINVTDLGLRLDDVHKYELQSETCKPARKFAKDLICTDDEKTFLKSGTRVELNAFSSPQFVEWLEGKLTEQGLNKRLVPRDNVLKVAYRRAIALAKINSALEDAVEQATNDAEQTRVPKTLRRQLRKAMAESPAIAWDGALYKLVKDTLDS